MMQPIWAFCLAAATAGSGGAHTFPILSYDPIANAWSPVGSADQPSLSEDWTILAVQTVNDPVQGKLLVSWLKPTTDPGAVLHGSAFIDSYDAGLAHERVCLVADWISPAIGQSTGLRYRKGEIWTWRETDDGKSVPQKRDAKTGVVLREYQAIDNGGDGNPFFDLDSQRLLYAGGETGLGSDRINKLDLQSGAISALTEGLNLQFPELPISGTGSVIDLTIRQNGEICLAILNLETAAHTFVARLSSDCQTLLGFLDVPTDSFWYTDFPEPVQFDVASDGWWVNYFPSAIGGVFLSGTAFVDAQTFEVTVLPALPTQPLANLHSVEVMTFSSPPHVVRQVTTPIANDLRVLAEIK